MVDKVNKEMTLGDIITKHPEVAGVIMNYGLHCIGCHVAAWETLEQGSKAHGLSDEKIEEMVNMINKVIEEKKGEKKE